MAKARDRRPHDAGTATDGLVSFHFDFNRREMMQMKIQDPPMTFVDDAAAGRWLNSVSVNHDPYGNAVMRYASTWATLMEQQLATGAKLPDIADKCSGQADTEGITGFMYGCAVKILSDVWIGGEALRKWHNGEYGHSGDGVVNPAIITIGP